MPRLFTVLLLAAAALAGALPAGAQIAPPRLMIVRDAQAPIQLEQARIQADIGGGLAETTIDLTFRNPNARVLEGELQFPLAPGQRVIGFALDIAGEMRPAVPVEKAKGRQVFEAIERRRVDPALLETTQGNNFKLRVYPIPPQGIRRVQVRLAQTLDRAAGQWAYRLPVAWAQGAQDFDVRASVHGATAEPRLPADLSGAAFTRSADGYELHLSRSALAGGTLQITGAADVAPRAFTAPFGADSYFYAEIPISAQPVARTLPRTVGLLWDSSGSGATRRHDLEYAVLDRYFRAAGDIEVRLIRLRDRAEAARSFRVRGGDWSALRRELEATVYDGATALGGWAPERAAGEYLLFTDGLENYGARSFPALHASQRLFVLNAADSADTGRLDTLAQRYNGRLVDLTGGDTAAAAEQLLTDGPRIAELQGDGLTDLQAESAEPRGGMLRIAGRRLRPDGVLRVRLTGGAQPIEIPVTAASAQHPMAPLLWAGWRIDALQTDHERKRGEIARLGKRFGVATRDTSLIVLDALEDYVRYEIEPPASLRKAYGQMLALRSGRQAAERSDHLERVVRELEDKLRWWSRTYPMERPSAKEWPVAANATRSRAEAMPAPAFLPPPPPAPAAAPVMQESLAADAMQRSARATEKVAVAGRRSHSGVAQRTEDAAPVAGIALRKWTPNERYLDRMKSASVAEAYAVYLDEKPDYANSTAFYLDVADLLLDKGARDLALRVLSNLAEMDLENRHILRILGYRLLQAGAPELAVPVFEQVLRLGEEEPQSWRDLGLAYAAVGRVQEAVDTLYEVAVRPWDLRFSEVELITLADMNAVIAEHRGKVDTGRIDAGLLKPMPLDLRVVLTWDADNSDMDLWVTDPNGERCMYSNRFTYQGGRLSRDATGGYGPEEFSLRDAKPGKYKVEVNFYGHRQQIVASATTLQVKLVTGFGTARAREKMVTLRLRGQGDQVFVGEFEVPGHAR